MKILVINAGSSSLKYQLFDMENHTVLAKGICDSIGAPDSRIVHKRPGKEPYKENITMVNHDDALKVLMKLLTDPELGVLVSVDEIDAVGHRIAHGGEKYKKSSLIDDEMLGYLEEIVPINPLHGPPAIKGIRACRALMPSVPQVGVFDTSFYSNMEDFRYIYPIPYHYYTEKKIRRYGFHGTSHRYVSARAAELLQKPIEDLKIVTCHLGNGSSITAVDCGVAIDTSMGFTPQEGIPMGTRSGTIDPTILPYLMKTENMSADDIEKMLNKESGLLGITGISHDSRIVTDGAQAGDPRCQLAVKMQANGVKKYVGSYMAEMNGVDVIVFTAGIGENDPDTRRIVCENMEAFGIKLDVEKNNTIPRGYEGEINTADSRVKIMVIPTDEELMIALDTQNLVK